MAGRKYERPVRRAETSIRKLLKFISKFTHYFSLARFHSVLQYFSEILITRGFCVLRYNSRGVGKSSGWPSFSGLQEVKDLQEVTQWALKQIPDVQHVLLIVSKVVHTSPPF